MTILPRLLHQSGVTARGLPLLPHRGRCTRAMATAAPADNLREFAGGVARYTNGVVHHAEAEGGGN